MILKGVSGQLALPDQSIRSETNLKWLNIILMSFCLELKIFGVKARLTSAFNLINYTNHAIYLILT